MCHDKHPLDFVKSLIILAGLPTRDDALGDRLIFAEPFTLIFFGIPGVYSGSIHTQVLRHPPVIAEERINLD